MESSRQADWIFFIHYFLSSSSHVSLWWMSLCYHHPLIVDIRRYIDIGMFYWPKLVHGPKLKCGLGSIYLGNNIMIFDFSPSDRIKHNMIHEVLLRSFLILR